jgi:hypothetical protein
MFSIRSAHAPRLVVPIVETVTKTMDEIMATCPTAGEIASINRDFKFTFGAEPGPIRCGDPRLVRGHAAPRTPGVLLSLYQAFRCMRALTFDAPMPVANERNLYVWLKKNDIGINVIGSEELSSGGTRVLQLRKAVFTGEWTLAWDNGRGSGIGGLIGLFVHEATHAITGKGHDCSGATSLYDPGYRTIEDGPCFSDGRYLGDPRFPPGGPLVCPYTMYAPDGAVMFRVRRGTFERPDGTKGDYPNYLWADGSQIPNDALNAILKKVPEVWNNDSSLDYGGAWAAQYWYNRWLAEHSGSSLSEGEKASAAVVADDLLVMGRLSCGKRLLRPTSREPERNPAFDEIPKVSRGVRMLRERATAPSVSQAPTHDLQVPIGTVSDPTHWAHWIR